MEKTPTITNEAQLAYNIHLDVAAYSQLLSQKYILSPHEYAANLASLNSLTRHNLETSLGERYNVELFQEEYYLENNQIRHPSFREPFLEVVKRGAKFRKEKGSWDIEREEAEVIGFTKVQEILTRPDAPLDQKVIVISPQGRTGSIYGHNFFDVWQKTSANTITLTRYTCKLSWHQFQEAAELIDPFSDLPRAPTDADFLANPLITFINTREIRQIFSPQEGIMSRQEYQELILAVARLINIYTNDLITNPNVYTAQKDYHLLLAAAEILTNNRRYFIEINENPPNLPSLISQLAFMPITKINTGCGISGGFGLDALASSHMTTLFRPFSVAEFGTSLCPDCGRDENHFHCPGCGSQIENGLGITKCPHCGLTKEQAGSSCG